MTTLPSVVFAKPTGTHQVLLRFDDGVEGELDLGKILRFEGIFAPLRDPAYFAQLRVDEDAGTIVWPNGADLDPLVLHSRITGIPVTLDVPSRVAG